MLSGAVLYLLAVVLSATQSLPLYADSALTPQEDLVQKLVSEWEIRQKDDPSEQREIQHVFPVLLQQERDPDSGRKETKEALQQEKMNHVGDYLKTAVLKLAAADSLRSQGFLRSEQNLPKPNKRACFWKYCVTN
ncbi:urotensin-related peptide 1 [Brachyhypopomus gauderio]|uniref:urotensin-related peptide 1 n=1 Tax=Brachyhypopomus gauderio TaxID=698409 RepID=UPI0040420B28